MNRWTSIRPARIAALAILGCLPVFATAQDSYPSRPVTLVIPFAPGGPTDVFGRLFGQKLAEVLGQPVVPENRAGAGGSIGAQAVVRAAPDGYTVLFGTGSIATAAALKQLPFDPRTSLDTVAHVGTVPLVLLAAPNMPNSVQGLLAAAKAAPNKLSYGSAGPGSTTHLAGEMLKLRAKVDAVHVPYKGSGPALQDTAAGTTAFLFETITAAQPLVTAGKLQLLAVGTKQRSAALPNVPTLEEAGLSGMVAYTWNVVFVPRGTPRPIIDRLNKAANQVLSDSAVAQRMLGLATEVVANSTPESARAFYLAELDLWAETVQAAGVKVE